MMPMVGLSNRPSGLALTHVMLKSYVTIAPSAALDHRRSNNGNIRKLEREIAILRRNGPEYGRRKATECQKRVDVLEDFAGAF